MVLPKCRQGILVVHVLQQLKSAGQHGAAEVYLPIQEDVVDAFIIAGQAGDTI